MKKLLVCDLDNTLYDWVSYFVDAFYALAEEVVRLTGCDREALLDDFRDVHRKHHDAEHPFALLETKTVQQLFRGMPRAEIAAKLDSAFHAFNSRRRRSLSLYPDVRETLDLLKSERVHLVAHTESKLYAVVDRLQRLSLSGYFSRVYCRERPESLHPNLRKGEWAPLANFPTEKIVELSHHQRKPNAQVLIEICRREGVRPEDSAYIGDSMARDVLMARRANVTSVWAKYGTRHQPQDYERLVRVSHWTPEDVARERQLAREVEIVVPDFIAESSFREVIPAVGLVCAS